MENIFSLDGDNKDAEVYKPQVIQTVDDILGDYQNVNIIVKEDLSEPYRELLYSEHKSLVPVAYDCEMYSRFKKEAIEYTGEDDDIWQLENYRVFPNGVFKERGFIYIDSVVDLLNRFPYLNLTSASRVTNDVFSKRYVYFICLPDGKVFTPMGYSLLSKTNETIDKYQIPKVPWVDQSKFVGNLESLSMYDGDIIYVTEGYFDSLRINSEWGAKSIALLGNRLTKQKRDILYMLKMQGHVLVYVRDMDAPGEEVSKNSVWDATWDIPVNDAKDVDAYVANAYVRAYAENLERQDIRINMHSKGKLSLDFYRPSQRDILTSIRRKSNFGIL